MRDQAFFVSSLRGTHLLLRVRRGKEGLEGKLLSEGDTQEGPEESAEMLNRALITRTFDGIAGLPGGES